MSAVDRPVSTSSGVLYTYPEGHEDHSWPEREFEVELADDSLSELFEPADLTPNVEVIELTDVIHVGPHTFTRTRTVYHII